MGVGLREGECDLRGCKKGEVPRWDGLSRSFTNRVRDSIGDETIPLCGYLQGISDLDVQRVMAPSRYVEVAQGYIGLYRCADPSHGLCGRHRWEQASSKRSNDPPSFLIDHWF